MEDSARVFFFPFAEEPFVDAIVVVVVTIVKNQFKL